MKTMQRHIARNAAVVVIVAAAAIGLAAQQRGGQGFPAGGFGGPMMGGEQKLLAQFDKDGDKKLNAAERKAAYEFVTTQGGGGMRGGRGGGRGFMAETGPAGPGPKIDPASVKPVPATTSLYDAGTLRTFFLT